MSQKKQLKNPTLAMWLSIIPGLGQFYNGQKVKAGLLLGVFLLEIRGVGNLWYPSHGRLDYPWFNTSHRPLTLLAH